MKLECSISANFVKFETLDLDIIDSCILIIPNNLQTFRYGSEKLLMKFFDEFDLLPSLVVPIGTSKVEISIAYYAHIFVPMAVLLFSCQNNFNDFFSAVELNLDAFFMLEIIYPFE